MENIIKKATNVLRALSVDSINEANSGHPGICLGAMPIFHSVFLTLKLNPEDDSFFNRDRFVLSAGHGSSALYANLYAFTNSLTIDDLMQFRKLNSKTPGHPERGVTKFVDISTGPLGQGVANAVGMCFAEKKLALEFNKDDLKLIDNYTYVLCGDGCLMEGVALEALSFAANLKLNKLIVLFDSNNITIDGTAEETQNNNHLKVFKEMGFNTILVKNGESEDSILKAIEKAKKSDRPSFIEICTKIGYGSNLEGLSQVHGSPLKDAATEMLKQRFGLSLNKFFVPNDVTEYFERIKQKKQEEVKDDYKNLENYKIKYPDDYKRLMKFFKGYSFKIKPPKKLGDKKSTRDYGGKYLNEVAKLMPNLIGGTADVAASTKAFVKVAGGEAEFILKDNFKPKNIKFGIREHGMTAISNGILAYGGYKCFVSTFFSFVDYLKPALRMSPLMHLPLVGIFTSDSIGAGEDGPTHQPVEQLAMLRATPNLNVFRPADETEVAAAYEIAFNLNTTPSAIILTRQVVPEVFGTDFEKCRRGFYEIDINYLSETFTEEQKISSCFSSKEKSDKNLKAQLIKPTKLDGIILASGSELQIAVKLAKKYKKEENKVYKVVSAFCAELFDGQDDEYKKELLSSENRIIIEAGSRIGLAKYGTVNTKYITMDGFGKSADGETLFKHFGFRD